FRMRDVLQHRGPDGAGHWFDDEGQVFLLHRRLSIIDPTPASDQPLWFGKYVLVFNGEIYNYRELKAELMQKGYTFFSSGDGEVIPAAYDYWGMDFLQRLDGMFAFALYHTEHKKLILARDRFGEKPLYFHARYAQRGRLDYFLFASEMKALWAAGVRRDVNNLMLINYLSPGYVQNPIVKTDTFFNDILNLPPGYLLEVDVAAMRFNMRRWYEPWKRIGHLQDAKPVDEDQIIGRFSELLWQSVQRRLRSDVPVGTCLSGGLDSSSIIAIIDDLKKKGATAEGWANVCFSAVFPGFEKNEDAWSKSVADSFGLIRYIIEPTGNDLSRHFDDMMYHQEEPVQSSSVLAQYLVYKKAKDEAVSVLLDGQGADEVLAGYSKYSHWYLQQLLRKSFTAMKAEKALLQQNGMLEQWGIANYAAAWLPHQTARLLKQKALQRQKAFPFDPDFYAAHKDDNTLFKPHIRNLEDLLYFNTFNFGLEELLRYADRNSMAHSREVRLPFLQHELVEFIFSLPSNFKIRQGFGKWILRQAMNRYLPGDITRRKGKVGFEPPQQQWMQEKEIVERIEDTRSKLVRMKMVKPEFLNWPINSSGAHSSENHGWHIFNLSHLLH
ncbi:MAG: asparagine synthase (glutamine-hydrolyzing), partial [Chitinophagaceae bacterium]|nr:asparagine synthase (glutamine-hydrolyzing) [Chitinophagaceae bacterium]